jgi:hypothetical protein
MFAEIYKILLTKGKIFGLRLDVKYNVGFQGNSNKLMTRKNQDEIILEISVWH